MRARENWKRSAVAALAAAALVAAGCGGDDKNAGGAGGGGGGGGEAGGSGAGAGGSGAKAKAPAIAKVRIASFKYAPPTVTVKRGGTVTWTNEDKAEHTATVKGGTGFDTGTLQSGKSKPVTFDKPGTFAYICEFHPFMKGTVVVQ